jgi:UDP-2,3-diacylglucosamine pyrophosphatase LpxH
LFFGHYVVLLVSAARVIAVDGVVCGHIHRAAIHEDFGLAYVNCGDWVESCTAVGEHQDGRLEIIHWQNLDAREALEDVASESAAA